MKTQQTFSKLRKTILYGCSIAFLLLFVILLGLNIWKQIYINKVADIAVKVFHKDKVESLLLLIASDSFNLKEKNRAIETLGFIEDKRALSKLESLVTHKKCKHSKELCQYELEKAIRKIKGEYNVLFGIFYIQKK